MATPERRFGREYTCVHDSIQEQYEFVAPQVDTNWSRLQLETVAKLLHVECKIEQVIQAIVDRDAMILAWQDWWQEYGFDWYVELEDRPQTEKPPFLRADHNLHNVWMTAEGQISNPKGALHGNS